MITPQVGEKWKTDEIYPMIRGERKYLFPCVLVYSHIVHMVAFGSSHIMTRKAKRIGKDYGKTVVKERFFILVCVASVALALCAIRAASGDEPFTRVEIMVSMGVGFLGLFIALRLVIQERNKKITENYFYKVGILWHIERVVDTVASFYSGLKLIDIRAKQLKESDVSEEQLTESNILNEKQLKESEILSYEYHWRQAELINVNTFVPAEVRAAVSLLLRRGIMPITFYLKNNTPSNQTTVQDKLLEPLGQVIDSRYFTGDRTKEVRDYLTTINRLRNSIKEHVDL